MENNETPLDIVYPIGSGSRWANNELRYSLRSLVNLEGGHGQVWIIGEKPAWLHNVEHVQVEDNFRYKSQNVRHKILTACQRTDLSERFVYMNDDFFFLRPQLLKPYAMSSLRALLELHKAKQGSNRYIGCMRSTLDYLVAAGVPEPVNFDLHYPMIFEKKKFVDLFAQEKEAWFLYRSVYGNLTGAETKMVPADFKIHNIMDFYRMRQNSFISTSDRVVRVQEFQEFLREEFSEESAYER